MESYPMQSQGQQVEHQPIQPEDIYAAQAQEDRIKNLVEQISPDNQLMDLQWRIKGYIKNPQTRQWERIDNTSPEIPGILISKYVSYLSSILNQNTTLTNLASDEINSIMKLVIEWLVDDMDSNSDVYGFKNNYSERTRIGQILLNQTFFTLKRSQNGMESRRIFKALNVHETLNPNQQSKGGMLDSLKFWK